MKTLNLPLKAKWYEMIESGIKTEEYREIKPYWTKRLLRRYDYVMFSYGYTKRRMIFKIEWIRTGTGNSEWGAVHGRQYYVIKLGERV